MRDGHVRPLILMLLDGLQMQAETVSSAFLASNWSRSRIRAHASDMVLTGERDASRDKE
jgi:hypothetical protein